MKRGIVYMNKIYFAKLLPVEGEIKPRDMLDIKMTLEPISSNNIGTHLRLFLCSRDITFGGNIMWKKSDVIFESLSRNRDEGRINLSGIKNNRKINISPLESECFKIVGEISPEATWVKEGDEWDADALKPIYTGQLQLLPVYKGDKMPTLLGSARQLRNVVSNAEVDYYIVKVKGQCGHFH